MANLPYYNKCFARCSGFVCLRGCHCAVIAHRCQASPMTPKCKAKPDLQLMSRERSCWFSCPHYCRTALAYIVYFRPNASRHTRSAVAVGAYHQMTKVVVSTNPPHATLFYAVFFFFSVSFCCFFFLCLSISIDLKRFFLCDQSYLEFVIKMKCLHTS